ncbi:MAG: LamG domain-containing protein [Verrucomicrobiota bacterium]
MPLSGRSFSGPTLSSTECPDKIVPANRAYGPNSEKDGVLVAHYMDFDYSASVTHYVKNDGGGQRVATPDYTISPCGTYFSIPSAQDVTFFQKGDSLVDANRIDVLYVKESGGGTFDVEVSNSSISSGFSAELSAVDSDDAATSLAVATIRRSTTEDIAVKVTGASGTVKVLGCLIYRDDVPEVIIIDAAVSSLQPSTSLVVLADGVGQGIISEVQPSLLTVAFADSGSSEQPAALEAIAGWMSGAPADNTRYPSVAALGPIPTILDASDSVTQATNDAMLEKCEEHEFAFYSGFEAFGSAVANLSKYGLSRDDTHADIAANVVLANWICTDLGLPSPLTGPTTREKVTNDSLDLVQVLKSGGSWTLEQGGEDVIKFSSGGISGSAWDNAGVIVAKPQLGIHLDGVDGTINLGNIFDQDMTTDWSVAFWINCKDISATSGLLYSKSGTPAFNFSISNLGAITFRLNDGTTNVSVVSSSGLDNGQWIHVTAIVDVSSSTGMKLYINNVSTGSADPTAVTSLSNAASLYVGSINNSAAYYPGMVSQLILVDKALSESERTLIYQEGAIPWALNNSSAVTSAYPMNSLGGSGEVYDVSPNGNDGTASGGVTSF